MKLEPFMPCFILDDVIGFDRLVNMKPSNQPFVLQAWQRLQHCRAAVTMKVH